MSIPNQLNGSDHSLLKRTMQMISDIKHYHYLEIGSWLGGSLHYHLTNERCLSALSVDTRSTDKIRDERQIDYAYSASTQDMLDTFARNKIPVDKLTCVDGSIDQVSTDTKFDLVFIDGEHTHDAAFHDATMILGLCNDSAVILFHDAWIVHEGIDRFLDHLSGVGRDYRAHKVSGSDIMGVALGGMIGPWHDLASSQSEDWNAVKTAARSRLPKKEKS